MGSSWEIGIEFVLEREGGYVNDPNDPGGETKYGISKKAYPQVNITDLTIENAKEIYKKDYWFACSCDELPFHFAIAVFDMAVNMGITKAKRILQIALGVTVDGSIGPKTVAAAHKASTYVVKNLLSERMAEYTRLIVNNQNLAKFSVGWAYRVISLTILIFNGGKK
ncbi:hypothetical protein LCGC14_0901100 [marine sediment metagenome]|uniref:Uncharacterized protein n=1 Tax=marine sediment metagenome TaxID=412755 RepID=A0A0F9RFJ2_9ZZZZ